MSLYSQSMKVILLAFLLAVRIGAVAQPGRPAVEYRSLLNIGFVEADGDLVIDSLNVLFPSPAYERAVLTVSTVTGEEVAVVPLRFDSYLSFPIFSRFVPEVRPTTIKLGKPGDFVLAIKLADDVITRLPLTLTAVPGDDPYDPPKRFWREGPWRDFGYFSLPAENNNGNLTFNWWMSTRELPLDMKAPSVTIHLIGDYKEVAASLRPMRLSSVDWLFFSSELTTLATKRSGPHQMTMRELVERDRTYLLIVKANGIPIKSFRLEAKSGRLQRAEQSLMGFEPHADFISPRFIEPRGSSSGYLVRDAYWVRRSGVRRSFAATANRGLKDQTLPTSTTHVSPPRP